MRHRIAVGIARLAVVALVAVQIPPGHAAEPSGAGMPALAILAKAAAKAGATAARAPIMVSQPVVQPLPGQPVAAPLPPAPPPIAETEKERKTRLKAEDKTRKLAAKAEKDRLKKEEKERKRAENKAKGGSSTGKKLLGCLGGGLLLGGLTALLGGSKKQIIGAAAAGCVTGFAFAALSKKDNEDLQTFVDDDFLVQDEACNKTWIAPETQKAVTVTCGPDAIMQASHRFIAADNVVYTNGTLDAREVVKYATASLRIRSAPSVAEDSAIIGSYDPGDKILTYGTTPDQAWTFVVERQPDGQYELLGYVASNFVSSRPPAKRTSAVQYAKLKPPVAAKGSRSGRAAPVVVAAAPARPKKTFVALANTHCKTANLSLEKDTHDAKRCGGAVLRS